jgi:hypothetical protein
MTTLSLSAFQYADAYADVTGSDCLMASTYHSGSERSRRNWQPGN